MHWYPAMVQHQQHIQQPAPETIYWHRLKFGLEAVDVVLSVPVFVRTPLAKIRIQIIER